jgi:hypothetical protein
MKDSSSMEPEHGFESALIAGILLVAVPMAAPGAWYARQDSAVDIVLSAARWFGMGAVFGSIGGAIAGAIIFARRF